MASEETPQNDAVAAAIADAIAPVGTGDVVAEAVTTAATTEAVTTAATTEAAAPAGKDISIPSAALGKLKAEQRERGRREATTELESKVKAAGFDSLEDMLAAVAALKAAPKEQPQPHDDEQAAQRAQPQQTQKRQEQKMADTEQAELARLQKEREEFARKFAQEQSARRRLERESEALKAEMSLKEAAFGKGVKDVDYALNLLQRNLQGKSDAELEAFDEGKFFDDLRGSHPYLFGITERPATTGTGASSNPAATVTAAHQQAGQNSIKDARSMSREEFDKLLRARNLNVAIG
jgi:hypothetical protein